MFVAVVAVVALIGIAVLGIWLGKREYATNARRFDARNALSVPGARDRALVLLANPELFEVDAARAEAADSLENMAPHLKEVLGKYSVVRCKVAQGACLDRAMLAQPRGRDYLLLGHGLEASDMEHELWVRPGDETIYVVFDGEQPSRHPGGAYSTVYHWIVAAAEGD
jgi:hypothetical protein